MPAPSTTSGRLRVESSELTTGELWRVQAEWEAFDARTELCPFLSFGWLQSWVEVYRPAALVVLRVVADGDLRALGLLERRRFGVLHFAGGQVTPVRGLACSAADEPGCWEALGHWFATTRATRLTAIAARDCELAGATSSPMAWYGFELPSSFEAYLQARPAGRRREFRRRLRVAERAGVVTSLLSGGDAAAEVETFGRLHADRARAKGERHRTIDGRLIRMLVRVAERGEPQLRISVCRQGDATIGVGVQIDGIETTWAYNTGFAPQAGSLSPGLLVRLASIEDAIERGQRHFDLGPGDYAYKRDLGGEAFARQSLEYTSPAPAGRLVRATLRSLDELRQVERLRAGVRWWRSWQDDRRGKPN